MRVKLFYLEVQKSEEVWKFQDAMNGWLRKLGRRSEFRIVGQTIRTSTAYDDNTQGCVTSFTGIIWYEKVRKEGDA
jgi:hypothetical protein